MATDTPPQPDIEPRNETDLTSSPNQAPAAAPVENKTENPDENSVEPAKKEKKKPQQSEKTGAWLLDLTNGLIDESNLKAADLMEAWDTRTKLRSSPAKSALETTNECAQKAEALQSLAEKHQQSATMNANNSNFAPKQQTQEAKKSANQAQAAAKQAIVQREIARKQVVRSDKELKTTQAKLSKAPDSKEAKENAKKSEENHKKVLAAFNATEKASEKAMEAAKDARIVANQAVYSQTAKLAAQAQQEQINNPNPTKLAQTKNDLIKLAQTAVTTTQANSTKTGNALEKAAAFKKEGQPTLKESLKLQEAKYNDDIAKAAENDAQKALNDITQLDAANTIENDRPSADPAQDEHNARENTAQEEQSVTADMDPDEPRVAADQVQDEQNAPAMEAAPNTIVNPLSTIINALADHQETEEPAPGVKTSSPKHGFPTRIEDDDEPDESSTSGPSL